MHSTKELPVIIMMIGSFSASWMNGNGGKASFHPSVRKDSPCLCQGRGLSSGIVQRYSNVCHFLSWSNRFGLYQLNAAS